MADSNNPTSVLADLLKIKSEIEENIRSIAESLYQKGSKLNPKDYEKFNKLLGEQQAAYDDISKTIDVIEKQQKEQEDKIKKQNEALEQQNKLLEEEKNLREENIKSIGEQHEFLNDTEDLVASIADQLGKSNKIYKTANNYLDQQRITLKSIASLAQSSTNKDILEQTKKISDKYKEYQQNVVSITEKSKLTGKTQEQIAVEVERLKKAFITSLDSLKALGDEGVSISEEFTNIANETEVFSQKIGKVNKSFNVLNAVMNQFDGVPLMREFGEVIEAAKSKSGMLTAAIVALSTAAGALAGSYFGAEFDAGLQITNDIKQNAIDGEKERLKLSNDRLFLDSKIGMEIDQSRIDSANEINRLTIDAAYASQRAANQFSAEMQSGAASFQAAAKTALFGDKLGGVGYGAAQLQLAGVGAEKIAEQMATAGDVMGKMPTSRIAADMAVMSTRTGASSEAIAQLTKSFMSTEGVSQQTALNLQEGMRAMATAANIPLNTLMQDVAEASKEMIGYQIRSTSALASQVAFTKSIGVNFNEIAKAGRSMVLNYKDSIKSEMQLSAILGRNVDLSEVRSKFASGDVKGAIEALKAQGLNPEEMGMFEQEALSQALGGIDLASLRNIATQTGKNVGLGEGNVAAANQQFLSRTQSAQATLNSQQAQISAQQAIVDAKLSQQITEAYLTSTGYKAYQDALIEQEKKQSAINQAMNESLMKLPKYAENMAKETQLAIERTFTEGWAKMLGGAIGAIAGWALAKSIPTGGKMGGGIEDIFSKMFTNRKQSPTQTRTTLKSGAYVEGGEAYNKDGTKLGGGAKKSVLAAAEKMQTTTPQGPGTPTTPTTGKGVKGFMKGLGKNLINPKNLLKGGLAGIATGLITSGIDMYSSQKEAEALTSGDESALKSSKKSKTASKALEYGGYGAALGSFIPGVGTAVGAGVGALVGAGMGIWQNWFSKDAKAKDEEIKRIQEQKSESVKLQEQELLTQQLLQSSINNGLSVAGLASSMVMPSQKPNIQNYSGAAVKSNIPSSSIKTGGNFGLNQSMAFTPMQPMAQMTTGIGVTPTQPTPPMTKGVDVKSTPELKQILEKATSTDSILNVIKINDHARGIITLNQMKAAVANDNTNSQKIVTALESQTKDFINKGFTELSRVQSEYSQRSLNVQEAMADLLAQLVEKAGAAPTINLDGKVLNQTLYNRDQNVRVFQGVKK